MSGIVFYSVLPTPKDKIQSMFERALAGQWVNTVRRIAAEQHVKLSNDLKYHGAYGSWMAMEYKTDAQRTIIDNAAKELGLTFLREEKHSPDDYWFSYSDDDND